MPRISTMYFFGIRAECKGMLLCPTGKLVCGQLYFCSRILTCISPVIPVPPSFPQSLSKLLEPPKKKFSSLSQHRPCKGWTKRSFFLSPLCSPPSLLSFNFDERLEPREKILSVSKRTYKINQDRESIQ